MKVAFLASGNLGFNTLEAFSNSIMPSLIATDSKSDRIIKFALDQRIPLFRGNPREGRLIQFIGPTKFDLIFSVNYLFVLEGDVLESARYAINLHGSLLPKYRGRTPHVWAIINNETETGVTAHFMDKDCDSGDIIIQKKIEISSQDTGASILKKYETIYPEITFEIINKVKTNSLHSIKQDEMKATFFEKRTQDDGRIDWNWQKERIYNWVRAQSHPYPGAFTFYNDEKIVIDEITLNDMGFSQKFPNGLILSNYPSIIIKAPNGSIELKSIRSNDINFKIGEVLK